MARPDRQMGIHRSRIPRPRKRLPHRRPHRQGTPRHRATTTPSKAARARSSPTRSSPSCAPTKTTSPTSSTGSTCPNPKNRPPPTHPEREAPGCAPSPTPAGARRSADGTAAQRQRGRTDPRQDTRTRRDRRLVPPRARRRAGAPMEHGPDAHRPHVEARGGRRLAAARAHARMGFPRVVRLLAARLQGAHPMEMDARAGALLAVVLRARRRGPTVARQRGAPTAQGVGQGPDGRRRRGRQLLRAAHLRPLGSAHRRAGGA